MVRSPGGVHRRGTPTKPAGCSREIDWIAEEHDLPLQASEYFDDEELEGIVSLKRRGAWSQEEDEILIQMVDAHSSKDWPSIARAVPGRSRKQCRDRWTHYLDPAVNQMPWSEQEEIDLIRAHKIHGNKWCELAKLFPGRTGKAIKNYWTGAMKKKIKSNLGSGSPELLSHCPQLIPVGRDSTPTSSQDSSNNIQVSSADLPLSSVDEKVSCVAADSPKPLKEEESTNFLEIPPALSFQSSNVRSDVICSSADPESRELHLASIADLLDMSYCESLIVIAPDSTNDEDFMHGM